MVDQTFKTKALPKDFADEIGKIIKVQGNLIDVEVDPSFTPRLFDDFKNDKKGDSKLTVVQRLKNGRVRCILSGEIGGLKPSAKLKSENENSFPTWGEDSIKEAILGIGTASQGKPQVFETGIKVIDLLCPFPKTGNIGMIGGIGVGRVAVLAEMYRKLLKEAGNLSIFLFVTPFDASNLQTMLEREPDLEADEGGPLQTAWLITQHATDPDFAKNAEYLDARPFFSPVMAAQGRWPAIDPVYSFSKLLDPSIVGEDHYKTALQVREILAKEDALMKDPVFFEYLAIGAKQKAKERADAFSEERLNELSQSDRILVLRARKLRNFFTQPFFVTADFTKVSGRSVSLKETIETCKMILSGEMDELPSKAFLYTGAASDIRKKAHELNEG